MLMYLDRHDVIFWLLIGVVFLLGYAKGRFDSQ